MRRFTAVALCAATAVVAGAAVAAGPARVHGHGATEGVRPETFTFAAVLDARGKPHGHIKYVLDAGTPDAREITAKVTCLRVIGTQAVIGGEILFGPLEGRGILVTVRDGATTGTADEL